MKKDCLVSACDVKLRIIVEAGRSVTILNIIKIFQATVLEAKNKWGTGTNAFLKSIFPFHCFNQDAKRESYSELTIK